MQGKAFVVLVALAWGAVAARAEINPIYGRLKAFRTYYSVSQLDRLAQRFTVWFQEVEPCVTPVAASTIEEANALEAGDLHVGWGLFGVPPAHVDPVPAELAPVAEAVVARIKKLRPNATRFRIDYAGKFRIAHVNEATPVTAPSADIPHRLARVIDIGLKIDATGKIDGFYGFSGAGYGLMAYDFGGDSPFAKLPRFVNYALPRELEGTSPLYARYFQRRGPYDQAFEQLSAAILKAVGELDAGTYQNPIESLLAAQGESLLPPDYGSTMQYEIVTYGRTEPFQNQKSERVEITFDLKAALAGPVHFTGTSGTLGLKYDTGIDLVRKTVSLTVTSPTGAVAAREYAIEENPAHGIVTEGGSTALFGSFLTVKLPQEVHDLHLPGTGAVTGFDVYPESSMRELFVHQASGGTIRGDGAPRVVPPRPGVPTALISEFRP